MYSGVLSLHLMAEIQNPRSLRIKSLRIPLSKVGFPIRISADQSFFAAPRGFSQRSTSFIASQRQGIHRMPLRHLIALIINAHPARQRPARSPGRTCVLTGKSSGRTLIRKTSFASDRSDGVRSSSRHMASTRPCVSNRLASANHNKLTFNARRCASLATLRHGRHITIDSRSDPSLHDVR